MQEQPAQDNNIELVQDNVSEIEESKTLVEPDHGVSLVGEPTELHPVQVLAEESLHDAEQPESACDVCGADQGTRHNVQLHIESGA